MRSIRKEAPPVPAATTRASPGEPIARDAREGRGMRILIGLAIIIALAYLGYRMFFVNAHKK